MKITHTSPSKTRRQYTAALTADEVADFFAKALDRLAPGVKVTGFRPGKAPKDLIKQQLDTNSLREEAYSLAVQKSWQTIIPELKEIPIQDPEVEIDEFKEGAPAKLEFSFDIRPEVKVGDWKKIKLTKAKLEAVKDEDVENVLSNFVKGQAKTVVTLEPAKIGDRIDVTFEGSLKGVKKDKLSAQKFPVFLGEKGVIPGFEDHLVGLKKGEKKQFDISFPKDHYDEELAGQSVKFDLQVEEVYHHVLPKVDDSFAKQFDHKNLQELKDAIRNDLATQRQMDFDATQKAEFLAAFEQKITTEIPESLLTSEIERSRHNWEHFLSERRITAEEWLKRHKQTIEQLEKDWRTAAMSSVKIGLGLAEVGKERKKNLEKNEDFQALLDELIAEVTKKS